MYIYVDNVFFVYSSYKVFSFVIMKLYMKGIYISKKYIKKRKFSVCADFSRILGKFSDLYLAALLLLDTSS